MYVHAYMQYMCMNIYLYKLLIGCIEASTKILPSYHYHEDRRTIKIEIRLSIIYIWKPFPYILEHFPCRIYHKRASSTRKQQWQGRRGPSHLTLPALLFSLSSSSHLCYLSSSWNVSCDPFTILCLLGVLQFQHTNKIFKASIQKWEITSGFYLSESWLRVNV